jgi:TP901-1 family phage major tail protein
MAAQKGREVLIKVYDGVSAYITIGGIRAKSISLNGETVDVSDGDSASQWRELLEGAGMKSASISGSGVFKDSAAEERIRSLFFSQAHANFQFIVPAFATFQGLFQTVTLEYSGDYNGEAQFSMSFESAGALTSTSL